MKALYSPTYLSLPRSDFCNKIVEEIGDDEEVLRYTRDLLFAVTRRKRKLNPFATLVERKSGEGATDKLLKDVDEIFSYCEGGRESLPKSLLKDNSQTAFDAEEFAASVQETIKTTLELSLTDVKASFAAGFQKCCDDMKATQEDLVRVAVTPSSDAEANRVQKARHPVTEVRASKNYTETVPLKKVILFVGDSLFHPLDSKRLAVDDVKAIKMAKPGDTLTGICHRTMEFVKQNSGTYDVQGIVLLGGTNHLRKRHVTPESLLDVLASSVTKIRTVFAGKLFVCKIPPRLDFAFVDSKISRFNDLISLSLCNTDSNLVIIETIDRETKFFSKDDLHLNKRKGCAALAGTILSCLYSVLRSKRMKARQGSEHRNRSVPRPKNRRSLLRVDLVLM